MRWLGLLLAASLVLGSGGCFAGRRKHVLRALPPLPAVAARPLPEPTVETPMQIALPLPEIEIAEVQLEASPQIETPAPRPAAKRRNGTAPAVAVQPPPEEPESPAAPPPPPPTPVLGEILTADLRRQYEVEFTGRITGAQEALNRAAKRRLGAEQQVAVQRIKTFLDQAEASRSKDLVTALQLARRADLLGQDLLKSLQ